MTVTEINYKVSGKEYKHEERDWDYRIDDKAFLRAVLETIENITDNGGIITGVTTTTF